MMSRRRTTILAGALLLVGAAIGVYFLLRIWLAPVSYKAPLVVSVQAYYPGANAQTVADTVAAPIEKEVSGVEHLLSMSSQSSNDGRYTLEVTFQPGTDLDMAQVLVQNRVSLALPVLPPLVQQEGISVRKLSPEPLVLVSLTSPDGRFDALYLSNYATLHVKDELARLPGVADVVLFGQFDDQLRVTLDADKLAALQLSPLDVVAAISEQNIQVAGGLMGQAPEPKGQQLQLTIHTLGRLIEPEGFENIIVKASPDGHLVRLKDVARVEPGSNEKSSASLNGKPAVLLSIYPLPNAKPNEVSRAVLEKLADLRAHVPDGLALEVAFDFAPNLEKPNYSTTPEYLVIDAELPEGASVERTAQTLERAAKLLRETPGVLDVLALTEHPFSLVRNRPCLVVRLTPKDQRQLSREQIAGQVRGELHQQIPEAVFRLSVPSTAEGFPVYGFPIEFFIEDRGGLGSTALQENAEALVEKMSQSGKFSEAGVDSGLRAEPFLYLDIDRTKCLALDVDTTDILKTLQVFLGSYYVNDFNQFGRTWQISVQVDARSRNRSSDILNLLVKNKQNQQVQLGTVMAVREASGPLVIERHNLYPSVRITANLAEGVPLAKAKALCETLAEQQFGSKQCLVWRTR